MKPSDFKGLLEPQFEPIEAIHRGLDGYVRFLKRNQETGELQPFGSVLVSDLRGWFPEFVEELKRDSYYTLNSYFRPATHRTKDLRHLNSCYADLDHHSLTFGQALKQISELQDDGVLPPASIISRSGKGAWLFWLLRDEKEPGQPPGAWPEKVELYLRIQMALHERLIDTKPKLGADPNALDASRVTRVPGSVHSGALRRVQYVPQILEGATATVDRTRNGVWITAELPSYALAELAEFLELYPERDFKPKQTKTRKRVPKRVSGWLVVAQRRLADFYILEAARGGFQEGTRNHAVLVLRKFLRDLGEPYDELCKRVQEVAKNCNPPLSTEEVDKALKSSIDLVSTEKLALWLRVTPEETEALPLKEIKHGYSRPRQTHKVRVRRKQERLGHLRELRLKFSGHQGPTVKQLQDLLLERGCKAGIRTVWTDAQDCGFDFPRNRKHTKQDKLF